MTSRRNTIGIPLGVAAAVLLVVLAALLSGNSGDTPRRLPVQLSAGSAAGAEDSTTRSARAPASSYYYGGAGYKLPDPLPDLPDHARAGVLTKQAADRDAVARLAAALGLSGEPRRGESWWEVVDGELGLRVEDVPGNPWSYGRGVVCKANVEGCARTLPMPAEDLPASVTTVAPEPAPPPPAEPTAKPAPSSGTEPADDPCPPDTRCATSEPVPTEPCAPTADTKCAYACPAPACTPDGACRESAGCPSPKPLPDKDRALGVGRKLLDAIGFTDAVLRADPGYDGWQVGGDVRVDGLRVLGYGLHLDLDNDNEPRYASGSLSAPTPGDRYPLLGVSAAVDRMHHRGGPEPAIACDANTPECRKMSEPRQVTAIELGLLPMWTRTDVYVVPAWLLTVEGSTYPEAVVALPDEYLAEPDDGSGGGSCDGDCDRPVSSEPGGTGGSGGGEVPPDHGTGSGVSGSTGGAEPVPAKS